MNPRSDSLRGREARSRGSPYTGVERSQRVAERLTVASRARPQQTLRSRGVYTRGVGDADRQAPRDRGRHHGDGGAGGRRRHGHRRGDPAEECRGVPGCRAGGARLRRRRCRRSSTAWRRPSSRRARRTTSTTSCGWRSTPTPTATARRTACTSTSRARVRPTPTASRSRSSTRTARTTRAAPTSTTGPSTTRSASRRRSGRAPPTSTPSNTSPTISTSYESDLGAARLRRRALRVARHGQLDRLPELRRADRDDRRHRGHRLAQRPRQGLHDQGRHGRGQRLLDDRQRRHDGHVLQRHDPDRRRFDRRRGPEGDRPDLGDLGLVRLLPRQRRRARAGRLPGRGSRRPHRVRLLAQRRGPAPDDLLAADRRRSRPTRTA